MIFYIEPKGMEILEYIPEKGEYIGSLNSNDPETKKVSKEDISIEKIEERLKNRDFLVAVIFYNTWQFCILANTSDGLNEIKTKYKTCQMLWYWLNEEYIKNCLPSIQYKDFKKIFG